jgi:hypothetical protein
MMRTDNRISVLRIDLGDSFDFFKIFFFLFGGWYCGRTNLNYTGSSTRVHSRGLQYTSRVHSRGLQYTSNGIIPWLVG